MGRKTGPLRVVTLSAPDLLVRSLGSAVAFVVGASLRRRVGPPVLRRCAVVLTGVGVIWLAMHGPVSAADMGDAVMIEGSGVLTTCRSWR